jgi:hypothetical protein
LAIIWYLKFTSSKKICLISSFFFVWSLTFKW